MRVNFDATKCSGYGACAEVCPSVFQLDEFGYASLIKPDGSIPDGDEAKAQEAARLCPEKAIVIHNT